MPELPEVETIKRQLEKTVVGAIVASVVVRRSNCYYGAMVTTAEVIIKVARAGKYLFIYFESGRGFVIHLKMTGRIVLRNYESRITNNDGLDYETAKHTRVVINLRDGRKLYYWDARTFGYIKYVENIALAHSSQRDKLGPDPWEMTQEQLYKLCQKYSRPIKNLILDQALIAGVGNIYANDGLWESGVDPRRVSSSLTKGECNKLLRGIRHVMERGLVTGGASDNSYVNALGEKGSYQDEFRVYKRKGKPCLKCGQMLERVVVGGRGTWLCKVCQI